MFDMSNSRVRAIETLAQRMYEANQPGDVPWSRRGWVIRKTWLTRAQQRLETSGPLFGRLDFCRIWEGFKSFLR
jgi:hypothetical protein